jgi:serine/threonine-protein kinase
MSPTRRRGEAIAAAALLLVWAAGRITGENLRGFLDLALAAAVFFGLRALLAGRRETPRVPVAPPASGASASSAPASDEARSIGGYTTLGRIGEGSFGSIYRARDPRRGEVALKVCEATDAASRGRFEREGKLAARLDHPAILRVWEVGEDRGTLFLVTELLEGEDLDRAIARREPGTVARRLEILEAVAGGLAAAHALSIIHRDIKPSNIRLLPDGGVKILDFGLARRVEGESQAWTRHGETLGSAAYMSPEQLRGESLDARTDVFSFGVTAYELLTFVKPFGSGNVVAIFDAIERREPDPVWDHDPSLGNAEDAFLRRCLAKRREDRFAHGGELIEALRALRRRRGA